MMKLYSIFIVLYYLYFYFISISLNYYDFINNFQEISYNHLLVPSRIAEPKGPIEDMMLDTAQPKPHTLSR
jgi:hypothetical protein